MSLATTAAPFDDINDTPINKKKQARGMARNKTYKNSVLDNNKVNSVLESIHATDNNENGLGDYFPPNFTDTDKLTTNNQAKNSIPLQLYQESDVKGLEYNQVPKENFTSKVPPQPVANANLELQNLDKAFVTDNEVSKYYNGNYSPPPIFGNIKDESNVVVDKLNFIINLLEEQKDYRTNNVTEEVVLYSFLGIFVIFVVDSFARVGKYTR